MTSRAILTVLAILGTAFVLLIAPASAQEPLAGTLTGPSAVAPGQATGYNLTLSGGPVGSVNYTVRWYVTGPDAAGALPASTNPTSTTGSRTNFRLNVTAPTSEQTITLVATISSHVGSTFENTSVEKSIVVITPIVLSATFQNAAPTAAVNVTARFYVDGALVGTVTIARINAAGQATATFSYLPVGLQPGTHQVRVEADLDGNGVINPARGEVAVSDLFYRGTAPLGTGWTILIGIAVFLPVLLVTIGLRRRKRA